MCTNRKCKIVCFNCIISNKLHIKWVAYNSLFFFVFLTKPQNTCSAVRADTLVHNELVLWLLDNIRLGAFSDNKNFSHFDLLQSYFIIPVWRIWQNDPMRLQLLKAPQQPMGAVHTFMTTIERSAASLSSLSVALCQSGHRFCSWAVWSFTADVGRRDYKDLQISYISILLLWRWS